MPIAAAAQQGPLPVTIQTGATVTLPAGANPSAVAVADFNQDRRPDVAVCEKGPGVAAIYLQSATGTFPAVLRTYPLGTAPTGLVAVRLDNDPNRPFADLVGLSGPSNRWTLLRNDLNGQATFSPPIIAPPAFGSGGCLSNAPQLLARYIDSDSYPDLAYTYDGSPCTIPDFRVEYQAYKGPNTLSRRYGFTTRYFTPSGISTADFDQDGLTDVVTADPANNRFWMAYATGDITYPTWNGDYYNFSSLGTRPTQVAAADVNRDSRPDVAVANSGSNEVTVFLNVGYGRFGSETAYSLSGSPRRLLLQDLNNDYLPELLVLTADNKLQIFQHTTQPGVARYGTPLVLSTGPDPVTLDLGDVNGDGIQDLVVACAGDNTVRTYLNTSLTTVTATASGRLSGLEVYPNPAREQLVIRGTGADNELLQATLLDGTGRVVKAVPLPAQHRTFPVADLPRGLYLLRLSSAQGTTTRRVVLE
ncbi:T9SS type A sorting domain-containing protein [Hymenobacter rigui]|nr:T9SS type A sorting domain-containing protein [Hymenobacter rigui]